MFNIFNVELDSQCGGRSLQTEVEHALNCVCFPLIVIASEPLDAVAGSVEELIDDRKARVLRKPCADHVHVMIVPGDRLWRRSQILFIGHTPF